MEYYKDNSHEEIIQLKTDLMSTDNNSYSWNNIRKIITDTVLQMKNEDIGKIFEYNLREIFQEKFGWEIGEINRILKYREIKIGHKLENNKIISINFPLNIEIEYESYNLSMEDDGTLYLINNKKQGKDPVRIEANKEIDLNYKKKYLFLKKKKLKWLMFSK